jgi:hypothetical protein
LFKNGKALQLTVLSCITRQSDLLGTTSQWKLNNSTPDFGPSLASLLQMVVDVLGVACEVRPLGSVKRKTDQAELSRRDIVLMDQR